MLHVAAEVVEEALAEMPFVAAATGASDSVGSCNPWRPYFVPARANP